MGMPKATSRPTPAPIPASTATPRPDATWSCVAAGLAASGLLWLSYFPADVGWLAWFALVPWLMLVRADVPKRRRYLIAWTSGLVFLVPALAWMRTGYSEMVVFWALLALYCSWYFPAALWLIRRLERRSCVPLTVSVPLVWTALEFARGELMGGFAWYFLGHTQHCP
jgi:apolipoprotein N-acyltransferase